MNATGTSANIGPSWSQAQKLVLDFDANACKPQPVKDERGNIVAWFGPDGFINPEPEAKPESRMMSDAEWHAAITELLHSGADKTRTRAVCYFIGADTGPIKIGYSVCVQSRLSAMQSGSPMVLRVLATAPGGPAREAAYHQQFRDSRLHGEWFERTPDILAEIERLKGAAA